MPRMRCSNDDKSPAIECTLAVGHSGDHRAKGSSGTHYWRAGVDLSKPVASVPTYRAPRWSERVASERKLMLALNYVHVGRHSHIQGR